MQESQPFSLIDEVSFDWSGFIKSPLDAFGLSVATDVEGKGVWN